ncbi:hypothetical protein IscW_ISCW009989, partial [Ixodes scapularis]
LFFIPPSFSLSPQKKSKGGFSFVPPPPFPNTLPLAGKAEEGNPFSSLTFLVLSLSPSTTVAPLSRPA